MSGPGAMAAAAADAVPRDRKPYRFSPKRPPQAVRTYFGMHRGELVLVDFQNERDAWLDSPHPRDGQLLAEDFRRVSEKKATLSQHFPGRGQGCWTLSYDYPGSWSTALVLAVGSALGGKAERTGSSGMPGGIGVDSGELWVSFLDGGVGVVRRARRDFDRDIAIERLGLRVDTREGIAGHTHVIGLHKFKKLPRCLPRRGPLELRVVQRSRGERLLKDRRIRRHPRHRVAIDAAGQNVSLKQRAVDKIEPNRLASGVQGMKRGTEGRHRGSS